MPSQEELGLFFVYKLFQKFLFFSILNKNFVFLIIKLNLFLLKRTFMDSKLQTLLLNVQMSSLAILHFKTYWSFLWPCLFLAKNLPVFVAPSLKLHNNQYCQRDGVPLKKVRSKLKRNIDLPTEVLWSQVLSTYNQKNWLCTIILWLLPIFTSKSMLLWRKNCEIFRIHDLWLSSADCRINFFF